jgi:hypothetical protein
MLCLTASASAQVILAESRFEANGDGWWACGDVNSLVPAWNAAGYIETVEVPDGIGNWLVAPPKYLNHLSIATHFSYELWRSIGDADENTDDVLIIGSGLQIRFDSSPDPPASIWTAYTVPLDENQWVVVGRSTPPSRDEFRAVLANATAILINADHRTGGETTRLRNVALHGPCAPIPGDLDHDGVVGLQDLAMLLAAFGMICP